MSEVTVASNLLVENCEAGCACQSVHLVLCNEADAMFAVVCMPTHVARSVAAEILAKADAADAQAVKNAGRLT